MSRRQIACLGALAGALAMALWLRTARAEAVVIDASGRQVTVVDHGRIASLGGGITEILYAVGAASQIVAVDTTSQHPPSALIEKTSVGYVRQLSTEGVLSLSPSLIIALDTAGPPEVVKALRATNVPFVAVGDAFTPDAVVARVRLVAKAAGREATGEALASEISRQFTQLAAERARIASPRRVLFILGAQNARLSVGGSATSADALLKLAGATNAAAAMVGFKPVGDEAIIEMQPDAVLIMRRGSDSNADAKTMEQVKALRGIAASPAGRANRFIVMDGSYLLGFGPRAASAAYDVMRAVYPDLELAPMTR
jgi:iron complex transport system substrate-binding protein